jgi:glycosyltransferase involved in cell wall biosynthesis
MTTSHLPRIRIYHNGLWAKYKGAIFSKIYSLSSRYGVDTAFVQISETSMQRAMLGAVDLSYHQYPFELLFNGPSDNISRFQLVKALTANVFKNRNELVVIAGYHKIEYWAMLAACILLRRKRAVFVDSTSYDQQKSPLKEAAKAFFFRRCDGFFCYGIRSKEYVASYGIDERRIFFRCQAAALPHSYDADAIRRYYAANQPGGNLAPRFLYIGRLSREKGLDDLLDAFHGVLARWPEARLDVVGSGPLEDELKQRAAQLSLSTQVAFVGAKGSEEIGDLLMRSAALILPSHSEPWGLVVNEALSYGCPVVVSNVCGCVPELVREGLTGYTFPSGDISALREAMDAAAALSKDRVSVAARCLELIEQYTPEQAAVEILGGCVNIVKTPQ